LVVGEEKLLDLGVFFRQAIKGADLQVAGGYFNRGSVLRN
jgi:hypothetical protein